MSLFLNKCQDDGPELKKVVRRCPGLPWLHYSPDNNEKHKQEQEQEQNLRIYQQ
jgi:hypothetical protein